MKVQEGLIAALNFHLKLNCEDILNDFLLIIEFPVSISPGLAGKKSAWY